MMQPNENKSIGGYDFKGYFFTFVAGFK